MTRFPVILRAAARSMAVLTVVCIAGCGASREPVVDYAIDGPSLNGVSVLRATLESVGHSTRVTTRLDDELSDWAHAIIRFASTPGGPGRDEEMWYLDWQELGVGGSLIYVPRDCNLEVEYWDALLRSGSIVDPDLAFEARRRRDAAAPWPLELPAREERYPPDGWKSLDIGLEPRVSRTLSGPWAENIDVKAAALPLHDVLVSQGGKILLTANEAPFVLELIDRNPGRKLIVANGSFLLNAGMVNPERRRLAARTIEWLGQPPLNIAIVVGWDPLGGAERSTTLLDLLGRLRALRMIAIQIGIMGLALVFARFPRLGRARRRSVEWAGRAVAHAEALGLLLARTRDAARAHALIAEYEAGRKRNPSLQPGPQDPRETISKP